MRGARTNDLPVQFWSYFELLDFTVYVETPIFVLLILTTHSYNKINLNNFGQRQAALFEATRALGNKRFNFTRKDYENGRIVIALVPIKQDIDALIEVVKKCPLLESTKKSHNVMKTKLKEQ